MKEKVIIDLTNSGSHHKSDHTVRAMQRRLGSLSVSPLQPLSSQSRNCVQNVDSSHSSTYNNDLRPLRQEHGFFDREESRTISPTPEISSANFQGIKKSLSSGSNPAVTHTEGQTQDKAFIVTQVDLPRPPSKREAPDSFQDALPKRAKKRRLPQASSSLGFSVTKSRPYTTLSDQGTRSKITQSIPEIQEISDDEEHGLDLAHDRYQRLVQQVKRHQTSSGPGSNNLNIGTEVLSDEEGDDVDDTALFSILPVDSQQDDDIEVLQTITRKASGPSAESKRINSVKGPRYNCAPGKCVELKDGGFVSIKKIVQDHDNTWIVGQLFLRHNDFKDTKWPRRHNEVVLMKKHKNGRLTDLVKRPLDEIVTNRHLILTNQSFPAMSSRTHPGSWSNLQDDKKYGPLFCRWQQTHVFDKSNKVVEESIENISFDMATDHAQIEDAQARLAWRGRPTIPGGAHDYFATQVTDNGHSLEQSQKYVFGDAFCGGGGASCGADQAGLFVKFGVDLNEEAIKTYKLNFANKGAKCILQDIHEFIAHVIPEDYMVDVLHLSPPCQPFSPAHTIPNIPRDEQNEAVMFAVGELLDKLKPRVATLEETYGLFNRHCEWFNALIKMFLDRGYSVRWTGARLEEYGLPQKRRRLLIVAAGPGEALPAFPAVSHSATDPSLRPLSDIHEAISGIPRHSTMLHHDLKAARYQPHQYKPPYSPYTQAKTITTSGGIGNYHPSGKRGFTIRELGALQRFPSTYKFADSSMTSLRRQIGNAVPPFIFKKLYREIIKSLKKTDGVL